MPSNKSTNGRQISKQDRRTHTQGVPKRSDAAERRIRARARLEAKLRAKYKAEHEKAQARLEEVTRRTVAARDAGTEEPSWDEVAKVCWDATYWETKLLAPSEPDDVAQRTAFAALVLRSFQIKYGKAKCEILLSIIKKFKQHTDELVGRGGGKAELDLTAEEKEMVFSDMWSKWEEQCSFSLPYTGHIRDAVPGHLRDALP